MLRWILFKILEEQPIFLFQLYNYKSIRIKNWIELTGKWFICFGCNNNHDLVEWLYKRYGNDGSKFYRTLLAIKSSFWVNRGKTIFYSTHIIKKHIVR